MASHASSGHFQKADNDRPFGHWEPTSSYLTDGRTLYRYVGGVPSGTGELVALEDCGSLKLMLFCLDELRALGLRDVDPATSESRSRTLD
jgi:hypothetical protein